jgi:hypothetical protein
VYLTVDGTEIPCVEASESRVRTGSSGRAYSGGWAASSFSSKREWRLESAPMLVADADTVRALLDGAQRTAAGDFAPDASVQVRGQVDRVKVSILADAAHAAIEFVLREV